MPDPILPASEYRTHRGGWVTLDNAAVNDTRLSFRARGLLAYLLGRPPGWAFSSDRIARQSPTEKRDAIRTALRELERAGYVRRVRCRKVDGTVRTVTEVAALPELMPPPGTDDPAPVEPATAGPAPGEPSPKARPDRVTTERVREREQSGRPLASKALRATTTRPAGARGSGPTDAYLAARAALKARRPSPESP